MTVKKKVTIIIIIPIVTAMLIFIGLAQIPVTTIHASTINNHSHFFRDCVSNNPTLVNKPITRLSMLGSHDALSNDINYLSKPNTSEKHDFVNNPAIRIIAKGAICRLAKAQQANIYDQLVAGVRYLDVRITNVDGLFYTSHGLISNTLEYNLNLILKFLNENPGEFILFNINNYYGDNKSFDDLVKYIDTIKYENKSLLDYVNYSSEYSSFNELTYANVTNNGNEAGVILFSDQNNQVAPFKQFESAKIRSNHHGIPSDAEINKRIIEEAKYCENLSSEYLIINQTQQSASFDDLWTSILNWSLLHQAKYHNASLLGSKEIDYIINAMPIYMCDYTTSDYDDFNNRIIEKLFQRNIKLA